MIALSSPTMSLKSVLSGAVVANQPRYTTAYVDMPTKAESNFSLQIPGESDGTLNGATGVTLVSAYGSTRFDQGARVVKNIFIYNQDTASVTISIYTEDGATTRAIIACVLGTLESLFYEDGRGWYSIDANGAIKTAISQIPMAPLFLAYNSADDTNQTGNGAVATVAFDTEVYDVTGNFASNTFTAPITGKYLLSFNVDVSAIPAGCTSDNFQCVTSNRTFATLETFVAATWSRKGKGMSFIADMDAADTATVRVQFSGGAGDTATIEGSSTLITYFSGVRVG